MTGLPKKFCIISFYNFLIDGGVNMAKILEDISRTFNEFLLLPNLTDERCIPNKVSL